MPNSVAVHNVGSEAMLFSDLPVMITGVCIRNGNHVTYEVTWLHNGDRRTAWVEDFEVSVATKNQKLKIGFHEPINGRLAHA